MYKWVLPTLSELLSNREDDQTTLPVQESTLEESHPRLSLLHQQIRAEREWSGAIAALNALLQSTQAQAKGVILSGPSPLLSDPVLNQKFTNWVFTCKSLDTIAWMPFQLLPASSESHITQPETTPTLTLVPGDPLATEQFCLVLTPQFSLVMVLGETLEGVPSFLFSFEPEQIQQVWQVLQPRILLTTPHLLGAVQQAMTEFTPVVPDYRTVTRFCQLMLQHLPEPDDLKGREPAPDLLAIASAKRAVLETGEAHPTCQTADVELLKAIAHEVRTPLATIRTLTRLLLKRRELAPDLTKRLEMIDRQCSEQIDRFGLIFRAVELETAESKSPAMPLTPTCLSEVFQQSIPRWQQQASQRQLTLDVVLPSKMPTIVSDPSMLDQVLTSLIERFTRSLPPGSKIQVRVTLAGNQLKLQVLSPSASDQVQSELHHAAKPTLRSLGQMLMFQPETGNLTLNLQVTKNLFQALGGKLIVRERPDAGEVMTIFLPLQVSNSDLCSR